MMDKNLEASGKQGDVQMNMNELSSQIINEYFDASKTGFWKIEKEKGVPVRLYADKNMLDLLGASEGLSPEECCAFHLEHVYPEDLSLVLEFDKEQIKGNVEVVYRYNHPTEGLMYVRAGGRMTKNSGKQITYVGYHKELADTVHVEAGKENAKHLIQRNRDMQLQKSQSYYRGLMNQIACGISEYSMKYNRLQYANEEMLRIVGAKSLEDLQDNIGSLWQGIVSSDNSILSLLHRLEKEDGIENFEGSVTGLDGQTRNIMARVESVTSPQGERSIFTAFLDITENRALKSDKHIFDALCKDYVTFFYISFKTRKIYALKDHQDMIDFNERKLDESNFDVYDTNLQNYYEAYVDKETAPDYMDKLSMNSLKRELEDKTNYTYRYSMNDGQTKHYFEVFVSKVAGIEDSAIMGYRLIDGIIAEERKRKAEREKDYKLLQDQINATSGLANAYFAVFGVDLICNQCWAVKNIPFFENAIHGSMKTDEVTKAFITLYVEDEDVQKMQDFTNPLMLVKHLIDNDVVTKEFHGKIVPWEWCRASWIVAKRDENGMPETVLFAVEDITELTKERKKQEEKDKQIKLELQQASQAKTTFLNNMSHDIRTPMNAILGYNNLMKKEITDPKLLDYQSKIEKAGNLLLSILNNVLDMARIESGKEEVDDNYLRVGSVMKEVLDVFEAEAKRKDIQFSYEINVEHRDIVCDIVKVKEVLTNLVSNAVKYTTSGGAVSVQINEIPCDKEGYVRFKTQVMDTGIGMSEEYLPTIFDSFSRERNTTVGKVAGTGLGMAIVKRLVELMGGSIEVESKLGKGTTFTIILDHKIADEAYYTKNRNETSDDAMAEVIQGKHVLLAEDNELNAEIATAILEDEGVNVDHVEDGIKCLARMEKMPAGTYDLILMDIQMPNMDGYKATQAIRRLPDKAKADIPIIAMTANAFEEDKKKSLEMGMNGHIAKPIDIRKVEEAICTVLKRDA